MANVPMCRVWAIGGTIVALLLSTPLFPAGKKAQPAQVTARRTVDAMAKMIQTLEAKNAEEVRTAAKKIHESCITCHKW